MPLPPSVAYCHARDRVLLSLPTVWFRGALCSAVAPLTREQALGLIDAVLEALEAEPEAGPNGMVRPLKLWHVPPAESVPLAVALARMGEQVRYMPAGGG